MRFEVPQFIEVEDKVFGPFTWKQFVYLAGGAGVGVILFLSLPLYLFMLIGGPIITLAAFLAFHRINNRPFSVFLESALGFFAKKKEYIWKRKEQQTITAALPRSAPILPSQAYTPPHKNSISELSSKLELNALEHRE
jgi:hypothetical protein